VNGGDGVAKPIETVAVGPVGAALAVLSERDGVDVDAVFQKMCAGDTKARDKIAAYMQNDSALANAVVRFASTTITDWVRYGADDDFSRVVLETRTKNLRHSLLGDNPTQLERLLVERIAVCALQVQIAETKYIGAMKAGTTLHNVRFFEDMQDRAYRRYLGSIKALAQVRRLQLPTVSQLNVATNQVNIAGPVDHPAALLDHGVVSIDDARDKRA